MYLTSSINYVLIKFIMVKTKMFGESSLEDVLMMRKLTCIACLKNVLERIYDCFNQLSLEIIYYYK